MRSERTAKWNRLLELEATTDLPFATGKVFDKVNNK
jgi:enolase